MAQQMQQRAPTIGENINTASTSLMPDLRTLNISARPPIPSGSPSGSFSPSREPPRDLKQQQSSPSAPAVYRFPLRTSLETIPETHATSPVEHSSSPKIIRHHRRSAPRSCAIPALGQAVTNDSDDRAWAMRRQNMLGDEDQHSNLLDAFRSIGTSETSSSSSKGRPSTNKSQPVGPPPTQQAPCPPQRRDSPPRRRRKVSFEMSTPPPAPRRPEPSAIPTLTPTAKELSPEPEHWGSFPSPLQWEIFARRHPGVTCPTPPRTRYLLEQLKIYDKIEYDEVLRAKEFRAKERLRPMTIPEEFRERRVLAKRGQASVGFMLKPKREDVQRHLAQKTKAKKAKREEKRRMKMVNDGEEKKKTESFQKAAEQRMKELDLEADELDGFEFFDIERRVDDDDDDERRGRSGPSGWRGVGGGKVELVGKWKGFVQREEKTQNPPTDVCGGESMKQGETGEMAQRWMGFVQQEQETQDSPTDVCTDGESKIQGEKSEMAQRWNSFAQQEQKTQDPSPDVCVDGENKTQGENSEMAQRWMSFSQQEQKSQNSTPNKYHAKPSMEEVVGKKKKKTDDDDDGCSILVDQETGEVLIDLI